MIEQADREVQAWVQGNLPDVEVVLETPHQFEGKQRVSLYLLALADPLPAWVNQHSAKRIALRYLITSWAKTEEEAHVLLGKLVFAALEKREYELSLAELPVALWAAFGMLPRPALTLWVPCSIVQPEPVVQLVRGPLVVRGAPIRSLHGIVLGPGDVPIMGAGVELPALQLRGYTDAHGRFSFATVPSGSQGLQLVVKAKGRRQRVTVEQSTSDKEPLAIRFDSFDAR
jgi:hypothetical protein